MSQLLKRWKDPSFILDSLQVLVFIAVGLVLALDVTGIWKGIPWLSENITSITLIAVCTLIVSTFLERRIRLERLEQNMQEKQNQILREQMRFVSLLEKNKLLGIKLQDGRDFTIPLETRLAQAKEIEILGFSLIGIVVQFGGFFLKKAQEGCKLKFIIVDPESAAADASPELLELGNAKNTTRTRRQDIKNVIERLRPAVETGNAEVRVISSVPPFSLLIFDKNQSVGEVQVSLYSYRIAPSDRPHFTLDQATGKHWYDFFVTQFDKLWEDAAVPRKLLQQPQSKTEDF